MKRAAWVLLAAVAGCAGIELVSPVPNAQPRLVVSLAVLHDSTTFYNLDVLLARGTNAEGAPRAFIDSTIVVNGESVPPVFEGPQRNVRYSWQQDVSSGSDDTVMIRPPLMAGVAGLGMLRIVVPARPGPRTIPLPAGSDLTLALPVEVAGGSDEFASWYASARFLGSGTIFNINGVGIPDSLEIPWSWLRASAGDTVVVSYNPAMRYMDPSLGIPASVFFFRIMEWRVVVTP